MKALRTLRRTFGLLPFAAAVAVPLWLATALVACEDENDPKTWVKRLDDPAQRANAIKRLTQFYEDDMTRASNNASAPEVKDLLDNIADPLTRQYTAGGLDDKTRIDLMKSALLGRLVRGEELRRRPCPKHKGRMWCSWGLDEAVKRAEAYEAAGVDAICLAGGVTA